MIAKLKSQLIIGGVMGLALFFVGKAYLGQRDANIELTAERDSLVAIVESEQAVSEALVKAHTNELEARDKLARENESALTAQLEASQLANMGLADLQAENESLQRDLFDAQEIPDSGACLNVFVPTGLLHAGNCDQAGNSGDGEGGACVDPSLLNPPDSAFSTVTFGDLVTIHNGNIAIIDMLNADKREIERLNGQSDGQD